MEYESPWHWVIAEGWRALFITMAFHYPIWLMKAGRWAEIGLGKGA